MPSKSDHFWGRVFSSAPEFFRWTGRKSSARSFQHWIMSDDSEAAAAYRSPAPLAVREECSRLTYPLPVTSSVDLPRMQQVDLPSTCYIKCWPTKNAAGWPPLYPLHQVINLPRMQQVDLPSTCYIKWLTYQECSRLTSLPVTSSDWPTKIAAGWPTLYLLYQVVDLPRMQQVDLPLPVTSSDWPTKNAAVWHPLYLLHQLFDQPRMQQVDLPSTLWHLVIDLPRLVARLKCFV